MTLDLENFEEVRIKGEEFYKTIGDIHCPYFKEKISFGAQGLEHLKYFIPRGLCHGEPCRKV